MIGCQPVTTNRPRCMRCRWRPKHPPLHLIVVAISAESVRYLCIDAGRCAARRQLCEREESM